MSPSETATTKTHWSRRAFLFDDSMISLPVRREIAYPEVVAYRDDGAIDPAERSQPSTDPQKCAPRA
jgi:hypothetical protein